jgi:hypothetical protein
VLAFSIGAQAVMFVFNVLLGLVAIFALFGHMRIGSVRRDAHSCRSVRASAPAARRTTGRGTERTPPGSRVPSEADVSSGALRRAVSR